MARAERKGKVLIDWSQNAEHKTTVSVYSLRAKGERPFVSIPVSWSEVESALPEADAYSLTFSPDRAVERVRKLDDLFAPVLSMRQVISDDVLRELNVAASTAPPDP
jgi:bifunctional non-homologous end joining protein LigD